MPSNLIFLQAGSRQLRARALCDVGRVLRVPLRHPPQEHREEEAAKVLCQPLRDLQGTRHCKTLKIQPMVSYILELKT